MPASDDTRQVKVNVNMDGNTRRGVYSNLFQIRSSDNETVIDFLFVDANSGDGSELEGIAQARVIMSNDKMEEFAKAVSAHVGGNSPKAKDADE